MSEQMKWTTENQFQRENEAEERCFEACDRLGFWPVGVSYKDVRKLFGIGFSMGFRHPSRGQKPVSDE